jgi:PAS domain S-box-containing protein
MVHWLWIYGPVLGVIPAAAATAIAITDGTPMTIVGAFVTGFMAMMGLMGWLVKRLFTDTIPAMQAVFAKTLADQQALFREQIAAERAFAETKIQHTFNEIKAMNGAANNALAEQSDKVRESVHAIRGVQQLLTVRNRLAEVAAQSADAIHTKTPEGIITSWNAAAEELYGYRSAEIIGRSIYALVPPELHVEEQEVLRKCGLGEHVHNYRTERLAKDGRRVRVSLSVSPIKDKEGRVVSISATAREV